MSIHYGGKKVNWKNIQNSTIADYVNDANYKVSDKYKTDFLDVSETISELSYLTHLFSSLNP